MTTEQRIWICWHGAEIWEEEETAGQGWELCTADPSHSRCGWSKVVPLYQPDRWGEQ